jgi:hypothetical protein
MINQNACWNSPNPLVQVSLKFKCSSYFIEPTDAKFKAGIA